MLWTFFFFNQNPSLPVKHYCILMAHFEAYICIYSLQCNFGGLTKPALHLKPHLPVGSWLVVTSRAQRCVFGCQLVSVCPLLSNAQDMVSAVFMGTISSVKSSLKLGENTFKYRFISLKQGTQPPAAWRQKPTELLSGNIPFHWYCVAREQLGSKSISFICRYISKYCNRK